MITVWETDENKQGESKPLAVALNLQLGLSTAARAAWIDARLTVTAKFIRIEPICKACHSGTVIPETTSLGVTTRPRHA